MPATVTTAPAAPPRAATRLMLRPGTPVLRRDANTLQVGLLPPLTVRLPDVPEVRDLLAALRLGITPDGLGAVADRALDTLLAAGLAFPGEPEPMRPELAVARSQFGGAGVRRLADRTAHRVGIRADLPSRVLATELLAAAGVEMDDATPAVWLVIGAGPVPRESIDPLQRAGIPHLIVSGTAGTRRIGPFVEPGRTACVRCVDAHEAEADPRRPFLVEQAARAADGTEPVDPVLDRFVLAWAVRDLCRYLEGDEPSTWSTTADVGPTAAPQVIRWLRHPHCGCAWDVLFDLP